LSIIRLAKRMLTNSEMVKDATHETWIEVVNSLKSFKEESDISTWNYFGTFKIKDSTKMLTNLLMLYIVDY
jgi:hypothetical protein